MGNVSPKPNKKGKGEPDNASEGKQLLNQGSIILPPHSHVNASDNQNAIQRNPKKRSDAYINFLKRVKNNFRVCLNMSPTGVEFKDHILELRRSNILQECTVLWVPEFSKEALTEMAYRHYLSIYIDEEKTKIAALKEARKARQLNEPGNSSPTTGCIPDEEDSAKLKITAMNRLREQPPNQVIECFITMYNDARQAASKLY